MTKEVHEIIGPRQGRVGVFHALGHEIHAGGLQIFACLFQWVKEARFQGFIAFVFLDEGFDQVKERHNMLAAICCQLAPHQVQRLNAVGAFVDHGDACVAGELAHALFLDIAVTAVDLLGLDRHVIALIGQKTLDDRRQQGQQPKRILIVLAVGRIQ